MKNADCRHQLFLFRIPHFEFRILRGGLAWNNFAVICWN